MMEEETVKKASENFIRDGLSIDETKVSLLMISYAICFILSVIYFIWMKEGHNLISMFYAITAAVTGSAISNQLMGAKKG